MLTRWSWATSVSFDHQALAKGDHATHSLRSCQTKSVTQTLGHTETRKRHAKLETSVIAERCNKSSTRAKGGCKWGVWGDLVGVCGPRHPVQQFKDYATCVASWGAPFYLLITLRGNNTRMNKAVQMNENCVNVLIFGTLVFALIDI